MSEASIVELPDTQLCREGLALARAALPQAIVDHSIRTFLLGRAYAKRRALSFDEEDLALGAIFHDLGLTKRKESRAPFTRRSSEELREFLGTRGVLDERAQTIAEAIDFHMQLFPRWSRGNVVGLLQVGAWMDLARLRRFGVRREARIIERAYPRGGVDLAFYPLLARTFSGLESVLGLFFVSSERR
jgi:hypothetical protein